MKPIVLTAENVRNIFLAYLLKKDEEGVDILTGKGLSVDYKFHFILKNETNAVKALLLQLPESFMTPKKIFTRQAGYQGDSFTNAFVTHEGNVWANKKEDVEKLMAIGHALGLISFPFSDRDYWESLPDGLPQFQILC